MQTRPMKMICIFLMIHHSLGQHVKSLFVASSIVLVCTTEMLKSKLYKIVCNYDEIIKEFLAIFLNTSRLFNRTSKWISPNIHKNTSLGSISLHLEFISTATC
ncbi:hypothetical protein T12_3267 [Trichinella patagoniensis]|uniref:Secreted protein n=1 Tax=Trichinella patagoniensis TaxID=990121 RepID=A0A0V1AAY2_9BILA|nr:hypothetical protein T12_3267 [Trichinella patagoniensis]